jgi:hypothetical protein
MITGSLEVWQVGGLQHRRFRLEIDGAGEPLVRQLAGNLCRPRDNQSNLRS